MASQDYDPKKKTARFFFRYRRKQYNRVEKVENRQHAERLLAIVEETILDLERGKLVLPADVDVKTFIMTGGKVEKRPEPVSDPFQPADEPATIASVFETYFDTLTVGSKASNSIRTEEIHSRHFKRVLGGGRRFDALSVDVLQKYVDKRVKQGVVRDTIHKELSTLRIVWTWAQKRKHVTVPLAWRIADLTLPKAHEKPPFQTWDQIARKIARGVLTAEQQAELWESLWLDEAQTLDCLAWVKENARHAFLYPMFAFAAYTGARRSELIRSEMDDWDLPAGVVYIRQKKADKSKTFTRRSVPIHADLAKIVETWLENHPGGIYMIAKEDGLPINEAAAARYFRQAVNGGKWSVLHGWHVFRHSLASNMASAGVDQRLINGTLGHSTDDMERRYRHLLPSKQEHAVNALFQPRAS